MTEPAEIDYSLDEYSDMLKTEGRCTLGRKTVYGIYVYTREYAKRRDYCGLYIVEDYMRNEGSDTGKVFKFPISYMELVLRSFFSLTPSGYITELIFCDAYRCYPTPLGLYPLDRYLEEASLEVLRRDILTELLRGFSAVNIIDYIFYRTPAKVFYIATMAPAKRRKLKYNIFIPAPNPELHAVNAGKLQLLIKKKLIPQVVTLAITNSKSAKEDGLQALGLSYEDIAEIVKEALQQIK